MEQKGKLWVSYFLPAPKPLRRQIMSFDDENYDEEYPPEEQMSSFSAFVQNQLQTLPWWALSIVIHMILIPLTMLIVVEEPPPRVEIKFETEIEQPVEPLKPEKKRDLFKQEREIKSEEPKVMDPAIKEGKVSDHAETANEENFKMAKGDEKAISDSPFEGKFDNSQIGVGGGAGGMFGNRFGGKQNLTKIGGSQRTESAVDAGLEWLKRHQSQDGRWSGSHFTDQCGREEKFSGRCTGTGQQWVDPGVSGLALLCFLGAGNTTTIGKYKNQVKQAVKYLKDIQLDDGCFGPKEQNYMYCHAIATLAMAEAYIQSNYNPLLRSSAEKAVSFLVQAQNPSSAWRYTSRCGQNDTSVTGWCIMALKSAKVGGINVPDASFISAKNFLDSVTETSYYRTGYLEKPPEAPSLKRKGEYGFTEALTAVAMTSRVFMGAQRDDPYLIGGAGLLKANLPVWGKNADDQNIKDCYYWYYGTLAMFQMGEEYWTTWNDKMKAALVDHQIKGGCADGSWDPVFSWGKYGGRVYTTSLNVLSLEIYYRYAKVFK